MTYMMIRHKVADFSRWKRVFDSHLAAQQKSGLLAPRVFRNLDDPNEVVYFFEVTDIEKARGFISSPAVPEAKQQSGVISEPDISFIS